MRTSIGATGLLLLFSGSANAAPPPGQSAFLKGMHDIESLGFMSGASDGCDRGWITDLQYIGAGGSASIDCRTQATDAGVSVIMRLDRSGDQSYPHDPAEAPGYGAAFASAVGGCSNLHVWVVGNEPNVTRQASDPDCTSSAYAESYVQAHQAVHAVAGHEQDLLLVASNSPYSPGCIHSLRSIIQEIQARGVTPDGFAIHAYTRAGSGAGLGPGNVTNEATQHDPTIDECPGGATWDDTWHAEFRIYRDYIAVIEQAGLAGAPVYMTESGNACDPVAGNDCYPDADVGYFSALYAEAAAHNATSPTKIRAITPYRWTLNDDGSGRDFEIGVRPNLLVDLQHAFDADHTWTEPEACAGTGTTGGDATGDDGGGEPNPGAGCSDDQDCTGQTICDLGAQQCVATSPCGLGGACGAAELCRVERGDCVPTWRGTVDLSVTPGNPDPFAPITLTATSVTPHANLEITVASPSGDAAASLSDIGGNGDGITWTFEATTGGEGTHAATLRADPAQTVYAIRYFVAGDPMVSDAGSTGDVGMELDTDTQGGAGFSAGLPGAGLDDGAQGCACATRGGPQPVGLLLLAFAALARRRQSSREQAA